MVTLREIALGSEASSVLGSSVFDPQMVVLAMCLGGQEPGRGGGYSVGDARGMGILSGLGCDHQFVVALDLQLTAVEHGVVPQVVFRDDA
jgi:hypothetical protein